MTILTVRHITTYQYKQPVSFGEHRMMLRPRESHDQRLLESKLEITPKPTNLRWIQDAFGNHVAIARFAGGPRRFASTAPFVSIIPRPTLLTWISRILPAPIHSPTMRGTGRISSISSNGSPWTRITNSTSGSTVSCAKVDRPTRARFL